MLYKMAMVSQKKKEKKKKCETKLRTFGRNQVDKNKITKPR